MNGPPAPVRTTAGELFTAARIVALCVAAAVTYGVLHDQVTARVCVEYFTVAHPTIVPTEDPTILGLVWGVVATWWVGAGLGAVLALAARLGGWPPRGPRSLIRPIFVLMLICGALAAAAGVAAWAAGITPGSLFVPARDWPREKQVRFVAVAAAHTVSYLAGGVGGLALAGWVVGSRYRAVQRATQSPAEG